LLRQVGFVALALGLVGLAACRFDPGGSGAAADSGDPPFDADPRAPDADPNAPDADPNAPDAAPCAWSYAPAFFDPCSPAAPDPDDALVLSATGTYVFDTDTGVLVDPNEDVVGAPASTIVGGAHTIWLDGFIVSSASTLRVIGSKPLFVVSYGDIDVFGTVDAGSFFDTDADAYSRGAGADPASCPALPPEPGRTCANHGGSGGGGGAFGGNGGSGGGGGDGRDCGGAFPDGIPGGAGGFAIATPATIRGGCGGRDGAPNNSAGSTAFGAGAPGGGALHLAARDAVTVSGNVLASGAGGGPGTGDRAGGGGGGSGGRIGLEGATVQLLSTAVLAANGGGGGGGCENGAATRGTDGLASATPAAGGAAQGKGEAGGAGGSGSAPDGASAVVAERGGGGGGGGAGFVILYGPGTPLISAGAVVSPGAIVR
jgi:hypothetical protein